MNYKLIASISQSEWSEFVVEQYNRKYYAGMRNRVDGVRNTIKPVFKRDIDELIQAAKETEYSRS